MTPLLTIFFKTSASNVDKLEDGTMADNFSLLRQSDVRRDHLVNWGIVPLLEVQIWSW